MLLGLSYPEGKYRGWDDHAVSNVPGTSHSMAEEFPYQMSSYSNDTEEHRPILVDLLLPAPSPDDVDATAAATEAT